LRVARETKECPCTTGFELDVHQASGSIRAPIISGPSDRARRFYVRLNNGTRAIDDERERERYIAQRWGRG
jgi:hypothetical protein